MLSRTAGFTRGATSTCLGAAAKRATLGGAAARCGAAAPAAGGLAASARGFALWTSAKGVAARAVDRPGGVFGKWTYVYTVQRSISGLHSGISGVVGGAGGVFSRSFPKTAARLRPVTMKVRGFAGGGAANPNGAWYERHPVMVAIMVATIKTGAADFLVQTQVEKCGLDNVDWRRVGLFTLFGAAYFGGFQYFLYVKCFSWWFDAVRISKLSLRQVFAAGGKTRRDWLCQIGFDLFIINHFFFTVYYGFKIAITDPEINIFMPGSSPGTIMQAAWDKYMKLNFSSFIPGQPGCIEDWIAFWKVWIIGDIIVFGMVPLWARLPVNNSISFIYVCLLSFMRGGDDDGKDEKEAEA